MSTFINRVLEMRELDAAASRGGLFVVYGRRRVGKTRLLCHWLQSNDGLFTQAIEGGPEMQLEQVMRDLRTGPHGLSTEISPKNWSEFFEIVHVGKPRVVCIDEFPYLVASDPTLPSVVQRFVDHKMPLGMTLILAGSSVRMMHSTFLDRSAPLYGRARKIMPIKPMSYVAFAESCKQKVGSTTSFEKFSLVGGIPKYWEFVEKESTAIDLAESLFFGFAPYFSEEPSRLLRDEGIAGMNPVSILEAIGRGAEKPSEIAGKMGTAQSNLTRVFDALVDAALVSRTLPFGESSRATKRVLYRIADPSLRFHFHVYSPHRSRWQGYSKAIKNELISAHVGPMFEQWWRDVHPGSAPYWESGIEFDAVRLESSGGKTRAIVTELKWGELSKIDRIRTEERVLVQWQRSALSKRHGACEIEVVDSSFLKNTAAVKALCAER
jgi:uncharacterized protein